MQATDAPDRTEGDEGLRAFFAPKVVAVVGASRSPGKLGHDVLVECARLGYGGRMIGVNPSAAGESLAGWPLVGSVAEAGEMAGEAIDLALVAVPAGATKAAVADCARAGVRAAVLAAAGLGELGDEGAALEGEIGDVARHHGMRLLGPNGFGLYSGGVGLNLMMWRDVPPGRVALVTQSGNVAIALCRLLAHAGLGLSSCAGIGNQLDVDAAELVAFHAASSDCDAVALYVEGLPSRRAQDSARRLRTALQACAKAGKPVVVLKGGRSSAGVAATATHTGALGGEGRLWDSLLVSGGAISVESPEEMVDVLAALSALSVRARPSDGDALLLTDGGGDTVLALDALAETGIGLAELGEQTRAVLEELAPPAAPRSDGSNPMTLDTAGGLEDDPRLLASCAELGAADGAVGIVVVSGSFGGYRSRRAEELDTVERLATLHRAGTPVLVHSAFAGDDEEPVAALRRLGVPVYPTVRRLARALALATATDERPPLPRVPHGHPTATGGRSARLLPLADTAALLTSAGIALPPIEVLDPLDGDAARAAAECIGFPVCLKIDDPGVAHKTEAGGVLLDVSAADLDQAAASLRERFPSGRIVVMPMLPPGLELLVGASQDASLGPFVTVGRGGVTAELDPDVALGLAPLTHAEAVALWRRLRCAPLLTGWRSLPPVDLGALADLTVAIGQFAAADRFLSIECNPVLAYSAGSGYAIADLRATRADKEGTDASP